MSGVLSGANFGKWVPPFVSYLPLLPNLPGKGLGHFVGAMEVEGFRSVNEFKISMDLWINSFKNAERVDEKNPVYVPGEIEFNTEEKRLKTGIPLNDKVLEDLHKLGKKFSIKI